MDGRVTKYVFGRDTDSKLSYSTGGEGGVGGWKDNTAV